MSRPRCYYCCGTGWHDDAIRIDVDDYRGADCEWCDGTGEARHSANACTHWIGPGYWIGGHYEIGDPLVLLSNWRTVLLRRRGGWDGPYTARLYGEIRQIAVSPVCLPHLRCEARRLAA